MSPVVTTHPENVTFTASEERWFAAAHRPRISTRPPKPGAPVIGDRVADAWFR